MPHASEIVLSKTYSKDKKYKDKQKAALLYRDGIINSYQVFQKGKERLQFLDCLQLAMKEIILNYFHDIIKAPMGNAGKPSFITDVSHNIYFGWNINLNSDKTVTRAAYGTGSGASSIGIDPRKATINPIFPELANLLRIVENMVIQQYTSVIKKCHSTLILLV